VGWSSKVRERLRKSEVQRKAFIAMPAASFAQRSFEAYTSRIESLVEPPTEVGGCASHLADRFQPTEQRKTSQNPPFAIRGSRPAQGEVAKWAGKDRSSRSAASGHAPPCNVARAYQRQRAQATQRHSGMDHTNVWILSEVRHNSSLHHEVNHSRL
jgi:hypothetical protein